MTQLDIIKAFLQDVEIQQKYGLTPDEVANMTMSSKHNTEAQVIVDLIRQMVNVVEDSGITVPTAASRLNGHLENILR